MNYLDIINHVLNYFYLNIKFELKKALIIQKDDAKVKFKLKTQLFTPIFFFLRFDFFHIDKNDYVHMKTDFKMICYLYVQFYLSKKKIFIYFYQYFFPIGHFVQRK